MKRRVCRICEQPITVHESVRGGLCAKPACRMAADRRRLTEARQAEERARRALASQHADAMLAARPELRARVALVVLVGTDAPLAPVPEARKERLHAHLRRCLAAVADPGGPPLAEMLAPHQNALPQPLHAPPPEPLAQACGLCRGYCCAEGGDEAFIEPATLARVRSQLADLGEDELCGLYLEALPERGIAGSCVFHGERGCSLPRTLRARICNEYYCEPIREWIEPAAEPLRPAAAVMVRQLQVHGAALIAPKGRTRS